MFEKGTYESRESPAGGGAKLKLHLQIRMEKGRCSEIEQKRDLLGVLQSRMGTLARREH